MLFQKKFNRARKLQRRKRGLDENSDLPEKWEEEVKLERGDFFAMLVAAFYTIFLPALLIMGGIILVAMLFFRQL